MYGVGDGIRGYDQAKQAVQIRLRKGDCDVSRVLEVDRDVAKACV